MNHDTKNPAEHAPATAGSRRVYTFIALAVVLAICFARPLKDWANFAWHSELYSFGVLVPLVTVYLAWARKMPGPVFSAGSWQLATVPLLLGAGLLIVWWRSYRSAEAAIEVYLDFTLLSFLCFLLAEAFLVLGPQFVRRHSFPAAFLIFALPLPPQLLRLIESFLQHRSADLAEIFFMASGLPVIRENTVLKLPGMTLEVAPECSGIHSTLVLFLASLVVGYLFLRNPWRRGILTLTVVPLALLRNAFRIFVVGQLCVQVSPTMIDSYIHRRGGPIFFGLSLIPLFLLLFWLRRYERKRDDQLPSREQTVVLMAGERR